MTPRAPASERELRTQYMTVMEYEFLIGDGSLVGAIAGQNLRFVYCDCGRTLRADKWRAHNRLGPRHEAWAYERIPDYITDCVVVIDGPAVWPQP